MHLKGADPEVFKQKVEAGTSSTKVVILKEGEEYVV